VLALPVILRLGRRIGGDAVGIAAVVLLAVSPFAVRYAVEARMYSLLLLLGLLGAHAVLSVHRHRSWTATAGVAAVSAAMLYTHYYAVFVLTVVGAAELWRAWRRRDAASVRVVAGIVVGALAFLPWLPVFIYQSRHTGAPWSSPPDANAITGTFDAWMGGARPAALNFGVAQAWLPSAWNSARLIGAPKACWSRCRSVSQVRVSGSGPVRLARSMPTPRSSNMSIWRASAVAITCASASRCFCLPLADWIEANKAIRPNGSRAAVRMSSILVPVEKRSGARRAKKGAAEGVDAID